MITRRIIINVITFFVMSAFLITLLIVTIFRVKPRYEVTVTFADSGGVFTGQEVTYRGVTVGRVGDMRVVSKPVLGVDIQLVIEKDFDRIPRNARARIMFKSAVGEQFVDLLPESADPPFFRDGDRIPMERTLLPVQQEELLRLLNQVLDGVPPEALGSLIETLGTGLGGRGDELHLLLAALDPVTGVLANRTAELNRLAVDGDRLGSAFDRTSREFVTGARSLGTVAQTLGRSAPSLARLLDEGAAQLPELAGLVAARKAQLDRTIHNLADVTDISADRIKSIDATLRWLPLFLEVITSSYDGTRLRFGLVNSGANPPCDYGTPRRDPGDTSPKPAVTSFRCEGTSAAQAGVRPPRDGPGTAAGAESPGSRAPRDPKRGWLGLVADTLGRK